MSSYVSKWGHLMLRCDGCSYTVEVYKHESDRLLVNDYIHENGWKTMKHGEKWINLCPKCKATLEEKKRDHFMQTL